MDATIATICGLSVGLNIITLTLLYQTRKMLKEEQDK